MMLMARKSRFPVMPVMIGSDSEVPALSEMMVPGSSGRLVFLMTMGMSASRTGKMASSCSTDAPM